MFWIKFWASFVLAKTTAKLRLSERTKRPVCFLKSVFLALLGLFAWWGLYRWVLLSRGYVVGAKVEILNFHMAFSYLCIDKFVGTVCGVAPSLGGRTIAVRWNGTEYWYSSDELRITGEVDKDSIFHPYHRGFHHSYRAWITSL